MKGRARQGAGEVPGAATRFRHRREIMLAVEVGVSPGMMNKAISYYWRLFATALCFTVFGVSAAIFGMLVFPLMRLLPGEAEVHRRRVRATFRVFMRSFVWLMSAVGVLEY